MQSVNYYSTNLKANEATFKEALLKGLAPDKGLYMPQMIPQISKELMDSFSEMPYYEIAYHVANHFLRGQIPDEELRKITKDAYNFEVPLENVMNRCYVMRLDHGPTASFKDFAARMMGRLMNYYLKLDKRKLLILTATSGDTGSAIANAFYGLDNIEVVVLYPEKEVTNRQRKQMTTLGKNVKVISLDGKFDDCQALVKQAFSDEELDYLNLSSANSINIGRLIPQIVYYFYAFAKLRNQEKDEQIVFSIPSGNFGNMMGSMLAKRMGLPIKRLIIATNSNDEFPVLMQKEEYHKIEPSKDCISSAMNVGHPSNLARLIALYGGVMNEKGNISKHPDFEQMRRDIFAISISDEQTKETIKEVYEAYNVILEPHGAVGWAGLTKFLHNHPQAPNLLCVSLETAHPAKFPEHINEILSLDPELPPSLRGIEDKKEFITSLDNNYDSFKAFLKKNYK
ncbi:MAG: threonine synthase [Bacteroidetes bacterium]|nr:threonine synthase [Bacteroidota bacterium]